MTQLKIDPKAFKSECARVRAGWEDDMASESFAERRLTYRCELKHKRHLWSAPKIDRSYEGHLASLSVAAMAAYTSGATDAQVSYLARLSADAGEIVSNIGRLTQGEASILIDQLKREAARRAN